MRKRFSKRVPKIGEKFHFFDAGRKNSNRHFIVEIIDIVPWRYITIKNIKKLIIKELERSPELFAKTSDFVCQGKILGLPLEPIWFTRTIDGDWYSIGFWSGLLDIDGTVFESVISDLAIVKMISKEDAKDLFNKSSRIPDLALLNVVEVN